MAAEIKDLNLTLRFQKENAHEIIQVSNAKQKELEDQLFQLNEEKETEINKVEKMSDAGSRHALQIAYVHMQKQLKHMKKEKDGYQKLAFW